MANSEPRAFWLNVHLPYRCRHSLACCSSGWPIPIERDRAAAVDVEISSGRVQPLRTPWLVPEAGAPAEIAGNLGVRSDGHCVFLRMPPAGSRLPLQGSCSIYSHRPLSCVHFPYVCLIDQRGVHVTLSHYCPTAASLLFDYEGPIEIVAGPPPIAGLEIPEGLDARESLPPAASAKRLMSFEEFSAWERQKVGAMSAKGARSANGADWRLFEKARAAVPAPLTWPPAPDEFECRWADLVESAWPSFAPVINRYLAARLFASWAAYLGEGLEAIERGVDIAAAVLNVETLRQCARESRTLDSTLLKEAIRQSDLLLLHYADRETLIADGR